MEKIYELLKKYYGYDTFRRGQEDIIRSIISGRDVSAVMPTGAGKSICYQIPALASNGITLVVSPLISLMQDQVRTLISMGIRAAYLNSSLTPHQMKLATNNARKGIYKIIYVAPERLETESFLEFACNTEISILAVDEAHCISQWGHDFRPSYTRISEFVSMLPKRPVIAAFTATATKRVKNDIKSQLNLINPFTITTGFDRENLYFAAYRPQEKISFLIKYVEKNSDKSGIIYCNTRKDVDELSLALNEAGYSALPYHAGMSDYDRAKNQEDFIYDRVKIIVATNAFGMGIDKPNVRYVVHYNMPQNLEEYYQQAGRAGRDGEPSECILLYAGKDSYVNKYLIKKSMEKEHPDPDEYKKFIETELEKLKLMTFYATSQKECLRKRILSYFGEYYSPPCNNCSICLKDSYSEYSPYKHTASDDPLMIPDEALLNRLRKYRAITAARLGIPVFSVFSDTALRELSAIKPVKASGLSKINGMGESKINRYGNDIINIIKAYGNEADF